MPDQESENDDRAEAIAWYFRLLVLQELDRGTARNELLERFGIERGHLHQIQKGKLGVGVKALIRFSSAFGWTPGEMLDRALAWWEARGRADRAAFLFEEARRLAEAATESGEHPSQSPMKTAR